MPAPRNRLKAALAEGRLQTGLWLAFANPTAAEIAARAGFDWCLIDCEHAPNDIPLVQAQCQAMSGGSSSVVVRVAEGNARLLKQVLDIGVQTVLIPMVDTVAQAKDILRFTRYPPEGVRGVGAAQSRATFFGEVGDYVTTATDEICVLVQAETRLALSNIEDIAALPGIDGIFIGPADLAADMGHLGNPGHPDVVAAIEDGVRRIRAAGKAAGIVTFDPTQARRLAALGFNFLAVGGDVSCYARALRSLAAEAKTLSD
ncbi:HpcH/HpaI aldolase family protein [Oceaniglobus trochenteri]|uniref:HpcH/HpaI aldolase family protein n=1 Tax=Oceaniglobus trochenteri TaxID=2763260 RepID=UPI001CFF8241|nr:HpcH/HpaI aldolase/citrate lyase family protein [Oceaniglobus trochenteri]